MKWLLFLLLLLPHKWVNAQTPYKFFHLFLDKGLSDARINAIAQDQYGFMWFASANGLNRFDGYSIKTFFADETGNGLTSNNTTALFSDSKAGLWVGTSSGLLQYDFTREKFKRFAEKEPISTAYVNCITEDSSGNIYAGTNQGLFYQNRKTGQWKNMSAQLKQENRLIAIRGLLFFNKTQLFVTTENKGFYKIDISKASYETIPYKTGFYDTCCLFTIGMQKMNDSIMLVGTLSFGLSQFNTRTNQFSVTEGPLRKNDSILFNTTYQVIKDHAGRFWAASYYYRLAEYIPATNTSIPVPKEPFSPYGFNGDAATCVFEDKQHNIWIGTPKQGVYRFNPANNRVQFHAINPIDPAGLQKGQVMSLAPLNNNLVMVGTDAGPSIYNRSRNNFKNFKGIAKELHSLPLEQVQCGLMDKEGIVWIGTNRLGLMRYDTGTQKMRTFGRFSKPFPLKNDGITTILEMDGDSLMLLGYGCINTFHKKTFQTHSYANDSLNIPLYNLNNIANITWDAHEKNIWIATRYGQLYLYNPHNQTLTDRTALLNNIKKPMVINNIIEDKQQRLWLASNQGAVCITANKPVKTYTLAKSVNRSMEIKNILPAGNYVWLTNNRSIARLNTDNGQVTYLGEKDGFTNAQLFGNSLSLTAWNTVLIGSNQGFYEIFPELIDNNAKASPAYLTNFRIFKQPLQTNEPLPVITKINLPYDQNFFSFEISAFDYSEGTDMEYAYFLKGFDHDWQYIGKSRSGSYTNVPGGSYTLLLKSRNSNGEWNEAGQQLQIHIGKPFWMRGWFYALAILALLAAAYALYKNKVRIIRKEAKLHSDYSIKLNELENSALRTQMSPHFIFNSLNTINSFINRNDPAMANQYISKFSKLIRLILDHSREKKITLAEEFEVLELYIQLERIRFDNKFAYRFIMDDKICADVTEMPPLIIQPFVENAILHGLLPLAKAGMLNISVQKNDNHILFVVEDNGIGRQQAKQNKAVMNQQRKSHGIDITLKRIELFNKQYEFNGVVNIIDLHTADGKAAGTRIEIPVALDESF